jgi:SET domain-containing protein
MNQEKENSFVEFVNMVAEIAIEKKISEYLLPIKITDTIRNLEEEAFPLIPPNLLSIRPSSRHGLGVFANQEIKQGEIVCLYPADFVFVGNHFEEKIKSTKKGNWCSLDSNNNFDANYTMNLLGNKAICADPNKYSSLFSAHMINDSVSCDTIEKLKDIHSKYYTCDINEFGKCVSKYLLETKKNSNVELVTSKYFCYIKALKDIHPNQELLTSYGFPYWLNKIDCTDKYQNYILTLNETQRRLFVNLLVETHNVII